MRLPDVSALDRTSPPSRRALRIAGWVMAACGVVLIGMMGTLLVGFTYILLHNEPSTKIGFTGGPVIAVFIYALFGAILAFGCGALASGVRQIRFGRRDLAARGWARYIIAVMSIAGILVQVIEILSD